MGARRWSIYGALHALVVLPLAGKSMAAQYDLQESWRQRYRMDDLGVARLRKTITRSAASLPSLILWALGPKEGQGMVFSLAALGLTVLGLSGVVRLRTWGWLAVAGAAAMAFGGGHLSTASALRGRRPQPGRRPVADGDGAVPGPRGGVPALAPLSAALVREPTGPPPMRTND